MANKLKTTGYKKPTDGVEEFPFDVEYKEQSQMHVNTINGANLSSRGSKMMRLIYKSINQNDEPIEMEEQKPKTYKKK